ncbi:MAG: hypothetical protein HIU83_11635 [Proteobacteria bacterium]|nr:hypothetical protein [Pseudomonadota bacterium]
MRLVIDEMSWHFDLHSPAECIEALETLLDQLDDAQEQGIDVCYSEDLFVVPVYQDKGFYDLYESDSPVPISWEVRERVGSIFARLPKWQELALPWPLTLDVCVNGEQEEFAPSVAWAHAQTALDLTRAIACVVFPGGRQGGFFPVVAESVTTNLWFVANSQNYREFFRWLIVNTTEHPAEMEEFAPSAFPSVDFVKGSFNGIKNMSKPYRGIVQHLVLHLGVFSDHGARIFSGPRLNVQRAFGSLGVNISDENGNTRADREARKLRTINVDGTDFIFWWHSKIERHQDRIHICPDRILSGGRLLVGIFCHHL